MAASSVSVSVPTAASPRPARGAGRGRTRLSPNGRQDFGLSGARSALRALRAPGFLPSGGHSRARTRKANPGGKLLPPVPAVICSPGRPRAVAGTGSRSAQEGRLLSRFEEGLRERPSPQATPQKKVPATEAGYLPCRATSLPRAEPRRAGAATPRPRPETRAPLAAPSAGGSAGRGPRGPKAPCGKAG